MPAFDRLRKQITPHRAGTVEERLAPRASFLTVCSVAVVAYAACDMIHEAMGHGVACALTPGVHVVSISTVALQTSGESRVVAAAGSVANVIAGILCFALFRRRKGFDATRYFLWLLATLNLMNGTGYLFFSGLGLRDWAVVIAGLNPHWMWRAIIAVLGTGHGRITGPRPYAGL